MTGEDDDEGEEIERQRYDPEKGDGRNVSAEEGGNAEEERGRRKREQEPTQTPGGGGNEGREWSVRC